jgi:hypothetical protein
VNFVGKGKTQWNNLYLLLKIWKKEINVEQNISHVIDYYN